MEDYRDNGYYLLLATEALRLIRENKEETEDL